VAGTMVESSVIWSSFTKNKSILFGEPDSHPIITEFEEM
jgi:hypothetical protein